jgi:hypothetical protein
MQTALCAYLEPHDRARLPYVSRSVFEVYGQPRYDKIETLTIYWNHDEAGACDDSLRVFRARCPRLSTLIIMRCEASRALAKAILSGGLRRSTCPPIASLFNMALRTLVIAVDSIKLA